LRLSGEIRKEGVLPPAGNTFGGSGPARVRTPQERDQAGGTEDKGTIVFATVEGDIHDIGKNIVISVLENHGYRIFDLGRSVPADTIIKEAVKNKADIIGPERADDHHDDTDGACH
jgi:methylmalonyl-CoA mutase cobalamin-binding subunit